MKTDYVHSNEQVAKTTCSDSTKIIPYIMPWTVVHAAVE